MTTTAILGVAATLFALAAALGSAVAILRSTALKQTIDVQAGTIAALEKARDVDREAHTRSERACSERIAALEGRASGLEGLVAHGIATEVAQSVVHALEEDGYRIARARTTPPPRKRTT